MLCDAPTKNVLDLAIETLRLPSTAVEALPSNILNDLPTIPLPNNLITSRIYQIEIEVGELKGALRQILQLQNDRILNLEKSVG